MKYMGSMRTKRDVKVNVWNDNGKYYVEREDLVPHRHGCGGYRRKVRAYTATKEIRERFPM